MRAGLLLIAACASGTPPPEAPPVENRTPSAPVARRCPDPAADAQARAPGAERLDAVIDPDGDLVGDPIFRACGGWECDYLVYACGVYLGTVRGFVESAPSCVEPAADGEPCTISVDQMMIHGELQASRWEVVDGAYQQRP